MQIKGIEVVDHTAECIAAKNQAVLKALEAIGMQAESYAKRNLTASGHIDTGLLRNSIAHAVSGEIPKANGSTSYKATKVNSKYSWREAARDENGKKIRREGEYTLPTPDDDINKKTVYVGSNVEYASIIEYGTDRIAPTHYIKNALDNHLDAYAKIVKLYLKGG